MRIEDCSRRLPRHCCTIKTWAHITRMPDQPYTLHSDGGARGNPGPAAYGYVLRDPDGTVIAKEGKTIGKGTNNAAEYQGVIAGLRRAKGLKAVPLACYLDSELVVKQLNGEYKVKDADIKDA